MLLKILQTLTFMHYRGSRTLYKRLLACKSIIQALEHIINPWCHY